MNDDQIDDLKQFIDSKISQSEMRLKGDIAKLESDMATKVDFARLEQKIDDVDLKLDTIAESINDDLKSLDRRTTKLEHNLA